MAQLDQEDIKFLEELAKELRRIDLKLYGAEADELENIVFRAKEGGVEVPNIQKINFVCSVCATETWMQIDLDTYVMTTKDLFCDDCYPLEEDK